MTLNPDAISAAGMILSWVDFWIFGAGGEAMGRRVLDTRLRGYDGGLVE
jgi:hypothetical protein